MFKEQKIKKCLVLLLICCVLAGVRTAPAKHLKVTAEGDTPKLIVTSEEDFGVEPKRLVAAKSKYLHKLTTQQPAAILISTTTTAQQEIPEQTEAALAKKFNITLLTTTNSNKSNAAGATTTTTPTTITGIPDSITTTANTVSYLQKTSALGDMSTTKATTINTILSTTTKTTTTVANCNDNNSTLKSITGNEKSADGNNVASTVSQPTVKPIKPYKRKQQQEQEQKSQQTEEHTSILLSAENAEHVNNIATTTQSKTERASKIGKLPRDELDVQQQQQEHVSQMLPAAFTSTAMPTITTTTATTEHADNGITVKPNDKMMKNTKQTTSTVITSDTTTTSSTTSTSSQNDDKNIEATVANAMITTATTNMDIMLSDQQHDEHEQEEEEEEVEEAALKLLELEKQLDKSVAAQPKRKQKLMKHKHQSQNETATDNANANGHDGNKQTKKKQLKIDKHILADIAISTYSTLQPHGSMEKSLNNSKIKQYKSAIVNNHAEITNAQHSVQHLGPIHMEEKIYSMKKQQPKAELETFIESHFSHEDKKPLFVSSYEHIKKINATSNNSTSNMFEQLSATTTQKTFLTERSESKISDIQVEVYDSTVDSIVAATNFKQYANNAVMNINDDVVDATKAPAAAAIAQQKFTQYVIDRVESSTQESNVGAIGKPEPAAIEIHINVSEGVGNLSEDLEFSYPQTNYERNESVLKYQSNYAEKSKQDKDSNEILVVEIIDTAENSTENSVSAELAHPIYAFNTELEKKRTDEIFMADMKSVTSAPTAAHMRKTAMDHDSDTIFYISNTEVKVGESMPTSNTDAEAYNAAAARVENIKPSQQQHRYEEDILLSALQNTADSLKIFRSQSDNDAPPLDVTYVGESVMEVEQSPILEKQPLTTTTTSTAAPAQVIIQPASLSEIGVPVIGELPPQIELKEFDFMPDEQLTNHEQRVNAAYEEDTLVNGNDVERLVESSIQYGGDLIDEGAVAVNNAFDAVESSYPFGNLASMHQHGNSMAKHAKQLLLLNHGVSNLRKDILSVDVNIANSTDTLKDTEVGNRTLNVANMNITYAIAERLGNVTAASMLENPKMTSLHMHENYYWSVFSLAVSIVIAALPVIIIFSMFCALRYFYKKYQTNSNEKNDTQLSAGTGEGGANNGNGTMNSAMDSESPELTTTPTSDTRDIEQITSYCSTVDEKQYASKSSIHGAVIENLSINEVQSCSSIMIATISVAHLQTSSVPNFEFNGHNGSVTKMTLKNNHLIVETEQRNDISRNARETKMHYNNATGKDGVFVVEVARGIDSIHIPQSPITDARELSCNYINEQAKISPNKQQIIARKQQEEVQIHHPPSNIAQLEPTNTEQNKLQHSNTGLSQSDLSSSSADSNKAYTYGKQTLYVEDAANSAQSSDKLESTKIATVMDKSQTDDDQNEPDKAQNLVNSPALQLNSAAAIADNSQTIDAATVNKEQKAETENLEVDNETKQLQVTITAMKQLQQAQQLVENVVEVEKNDNTNKQSTDIDTNSAASVHEQTYDSLMSLPEPPSFEEIKQLSDSNAGDTNQLDSLPLPPPPPLFLAEKVETQLSIERENSSNLDSDCLKIAQAASDLENIQLNNDKELLSTQLTPPESPPATNCSNSLGNAVLCAPLTAVAVNVNGS